MSHQARYRRRTLRRGRLPWITTIVGGMAIPQMQHPDCGVFGTQNADGTFFWRGSCVLIHSRVAITAAHCLRDAPSPTHACFHVDDARNMTQNTAGVDLQQIARAEEHPDHDDNRPFDDIAVLVLQNDARTTPTRLARKSSISQARDATLVGFGSEHPTRNVSSGIKRLIQLPVLRFRRNVEVELGLNIGFEFLAGVEDEDDPRNVSNGDSGGPAYILVNGEPRVAAIISRGNDNTAEIERGRWPILVKGAPYIQVLRDISGHRINI
ncbi:MAG: trypsin-like serine protease [Acidobacteria bacterium]|nr:trypsin-like serine protease [Acidobacteriota bacterium]